MNKNKQASELISEEINKYGNIDSDANNDFDCFNLDDFQTELSIKENNSSGINGSEQSKLNEQEDYNMKEISGIMKSILGD